MHSHPASDFDLGARWAYLLRDLVYVGPHKAKRIAAEWECSVSLAKLWLSGGKPTSDQIAAAQSKWGDVVLHVLFGREPIRNLDERLDAVKLRIAALNSGDGEGSTSHGQDHRRVDAAVSDMARGGERAQGRVVESAEAPTVNHDQTWVGWLLLCAQLRGGAR